MALGGIYKILAAQSGSYLHLNNSDLMHLSLFIKLPKYGHLSKDGKNLIHLGIAYASSFRMRVAQHFFLLLSLFILLTHSFVPHVHEFEEEARSLSELESRLPLNVLEWLVAAFQQDLGEDHLENYCPSNKYFDAFLLPFVNNQPEFSSQPLIRFELELTYLPHQDFLCSADHTSFIENRGPPTL